MTLSTSAVAVCCCSDRQIVGALAQLVEQPRILDGDDGLGGEVLHEIDLLVGEGADLLAVDDDRADQLIVLEHRNAKTSAGPPKLASCLAAGRAPNMTIRAACHRHGLRAWCARTRPRPVAGRRRSRMRSRCRSRHSR